MTTVDPFTVLLTSPPLLTNKRAATTSVPAYQAAEGPTPKRFQLHSKKLHLTYKTHLPLQDYLNWLIANVGPLKWYSLVHENGSMDTELPYAHTHVAFMTVNSLHLSSANRLDYPGHGTQPIHPNIKSIRDTAHALQIWTYHLKDPVAILRSPEGPVPPLNLLQRLQDAPSLIEAISLAHLEVKSISDLVHLRSHKDIHQTIPSLDQQCSWTHQAPSNFKCLFVTGATGTGKTRWALSQFVSPLLVSHMSDLKQYSPNQHDGIVFDDMEFRKMSAAEAIHILDWEMPRTLNVKHGSVTIPANTRKIFTSNQAFAEVMPECPEQTFLALLRRVTIMPVTSNLYTNNLLLTKPSESEQSVLTMADADLTNYEDWDAIETLLNLQPE